MDRDRVADALRLGRFVRLGTLLIVARLGLAVLFGFTAVGLLAMFLFSPRRAEDAIRSILRDITWHRYERELRAYKTGQLP